MKKQFSRSAVRLDEEEEKEEEDEGRRRKRRTERSSRRWISQWFAWVLDHLHV